MVISKIKFDKQKKKFDKQKVKLSFHRAKLCVHVLSFRPPESQFNEQNCSIDLGWPVSRLV